MKKPIDRSRQGDEENGGEPPSTIGGQFQLKTTAHWKALSHPLRASIIRLLTEQELTNEELADRLGVEGGKLYFHTKHLLDAGLIEIAETRTKGSIVEKVYRSVARYFVATELPDTTDEETPPFDAIVSLLPILYRQAWRDDPAWASSKIHYTYHLSHRVAPDRIQEFVTRLQNLVEEFKDIRTEDAEATEYSFGVVLHAIPPETPRRK